MAGVIVGRIVETALRMPEVVVVVDLQRSLTFAELLREADQLAERLPDAQTHEPVVILIEKSVDAIVAIVACLLRGRLYSTLDTTMPAVPLQAVLDNLRPAAVVTARRFDGLLGQVQLGQAQVIRIDDVPPPDTTTTLADVAERAVTATSHLSGTDPIYIVHTSGSTGIPKGVTASHLGVFEIVSWAVDTFGVTADDRFGSQAALHFDNSTIDLFSCLVTGATLDLLPEHLYAFPVRLVETMRDHRVTIILWVPSALVNVADRKALRTTPLPDLRWVLFCGEVMPARQLAEWMQQVPGSRYANLYGPTEITVICSCHVVTTVPENDELIPIGRACRQAEVLVITQGGRPAEVGEQGELYVRGGGVALGYYGAADATASAFVQNPLHEAYRDIVYRTGDMGHRDADGVLHFAGRRDQQIKHLGYRVELGAIEAVANSLPDVRHSAAFYDESRKLLSLVVAGDDVGSPQSLRAELVTLLPRYMVPRHIETRRQMPLNRNGKIDRQVLRESLLLGDAVNR